MIIKIITLALRGAAAALRAAQSRFARSPLTSLKSPLTSLKFPLNPLTSLKSPLKPLKSLYSAVISRFLHSLRLQVSLAILIVFVPVALILLWSGGRSAAAAWFDELFAYRQALTIGNTGSAVTNRKVKIDVDTATLITAGKMQSDCDDVRFTDNNGKLLDYFIDTNEAACNTSSTDFYIKMDVIAGNQVVYMYYGNSQATNTRKNDFFADGSLGVGLKGYWKLDEASGTRSDYAHTNDLTDNNTVTQATGKVSSAGQFTKANSEYLSIASPATPFVINAGESFTVAAWYYVDSATAVHNPLVTRAALNGTFQYTLGLNSSSVPTWLTSSNGTVWAEVQNSAVTSSAWHFTVAWFDNTAQKAYIQTDGGTVAEVAQTGIKTGDLPFLIGRHNDPTTDWDGRIDNAMFYKKVLTASERASLYNSGNGLEISSPLTFTPTSGPTAASEEKSQGPVSYWKFDEGYGTTAQDSMPNNNDGSISGATWVSSDLCVSSHCLQFDGSDDVTTITNTTSIDLNDQLAGAFTISGWIRANSDGEGDVGEIAQKGTSTYLRVTKEGSDGLADFEAKLDLATADATISVSNGLNINKWHYVTVVYTDDGDDEITAYIDGVQKGVSTDGSGAPAADTNNLLIGGNTAANFHGFIDDVKIYNYARTAAQIKADFSSRGASKGSSASINNQQSAINNGLSNGLVGYWKMDESSWTNNCSTTSVTDSSGNGNNGTACPASTGPTGGAAGKFGNSGSFDGSDDYINIADSSSLGITSNLSASAWVYLNSNSAYQSIFAKWTNTSSNNEWQLIITSSGNVQFCKSHTGLHSDEGSICATGSTTLSTSTWYLVTATYDNSSLISRVFVNGAQDGSVSYTNSGIFNGTSALITGARQITSGSYDLFLNGKLDETRIYNRALSPKEVRDLYNFAPGPVGYWKMDENTGTSAYDASGNANTGTWNGSGAHWTPGKYGSGGKFSNTTSDYISMGDPASGIFDFGTTNFTAAAWAKRNSSGRWDEVVAKYPNGQGWLLDFRDTNEVQFFISDGLNTANLVSTATYTDTNWHYLVGVRDGTQTRLYVDGVQVPNSPFNASSVGSVSNSTALQIGSKDTSSSPNYMNGNIDDVRIFNYARTQKQIVEDMLGGGSVIASGARQSVSGAVAHYKFDEGYGTTANDTTLNDNDLTLSTASWTNSGKFGKAWNGTNALWLSRADDADFDLTATDDYAISLWFKSDSATNPSAVEYLLNKANATTAGYAVYANTDGTICFGIDDDATWNPDIASCTTADFYDAAWHHIIGQRDTVQDKTYIYIDGVLRDSDTDSTTATLANSLSLYVGDRDGTDNGDEFTGDIDELKIYRYSLTSDEVKTEYNRGSALVLGALGTDPSNPLTPLNSSNALYCPPGNTEGNCASGQAPAPVGEWNFEEGSGTSAQDTSGNANTGTLTGGPTWTAGKIGKGLSFDGSDDYVDRGTGPTAVNTVSFWVKPTTTTEYPIDLNGTAYVWINGGTVTAQGFTSATIYVNGVVSSTVVAGTWQHVAVTTATSLNATDFDIGRIEGVGNMEGVIDEVRVYNYARTAAQIAWDYNRGGPVAHFKFDECQGTTVNSSKSPLDSSSSPLTGTITIGATGTNTSAGTCTGSAGEAWKDGATGKFNSSLDFDGTDDYTQVTDTANLRFDESTKDFSLFAWVKRTTTGTEYIISKEDADDDGWRMMFNSSNQVVCSEDATDVTSSSTIADTNWHLLGCTIDRDGNGQVYIDARLDGSAVAMGTDAMATTSNIRLATRSYTSTSYLNGQIDDVKIFNYALTATQVKTEYNQGAAIRFGPSTGSP